MLNLHPLFYSPKESDISFYQSLLLTEKQKQLLQKARNTIRSYLVDRLPIRLAAVKLLPSNVGGVHFSTEGALALQVLNAPMQPHKCLEVYYGSYVPVLEDFYGYPKGPSPLEITSLIETTLVPLIHQQGWWLGHDSDSPICIELTPSIRMVMPVYGLLGTQQMDNPCGGTNSPQKFVADERHPMLPRSGRKIYYADLKRGWVLSNPGAVSIWFEKQVSVKGEQLRRVVRYLKAFRGWNWQDGGPFFFLIAVSAATHFQPYKQRDDLALLNVLADFPKNIRRKRGVITEYGAESYSGKEHIDVEEIASAYEWLADSLQNAIHSKSPTEACQILRQEFGPKFPNDPDRISVPRVRNSLLNSLNQ